MTVETTEACDQKPMIKALLVEDDDLDARILTTFAHMNENLFVRFTRANSVAEAMQIACNDSFDIYFVDLHVGEATALRLLSDLESKGANAVVVSNATPQDVSRYRLDSGGLRFLAKPQCSAAVIGALMREAAAARAAR